MAPPGILHIVNWYPNRHNPNAALWIREQIEALHPYRPSDVVHIEVKAGKKWRKLGSIDDKVLSYAFEVPFRKWFFIEILSTLLLLYVLIFKKKLSKYSLLNIHIAYPLCVYLHLFRKAIGIPIVISEHWSAYHFNFHVADPTKLYRIKRIFQKNDIPLITVSSSLKSDIEKFAEVDLTGYVLPNVVAMKGPLPEGRLPTPFRFLMLSAWKGPKKPVLGIRAFVEAFEGRTDVEMCIGGHGPFVDAIKQEIGRQEGSPPLFFIGKLDREKVEAEMKRAHAFVHCSEHETFSVVCAEALANGTPVLASDKGGIGEFVTPEVGMLVSSNNVAAWRSSFLEFETRFLKGEGFDRSATAKYFRDKFGPEKVGKAYAEILDKEARHQAKRRRERQDGG